MSHGGPHPNPDSGANYIIICSGRIAVQVAKSKEEKIDAASMCASGLAQHLEVHYDVDKEHLGPISHLQHYLMDNMETMSKEEADVKIQEMFGLLDALEHEYSGDHEY